MVHCLDLHRHMVTNQGRKHKAVNVKNDFNLMSRNALNFDKRHEEYR